MKTQINIKLNENILEKLDEKAKEEHRTRTNLIEKILMDELGVKQYWLWVNSSKMDIGDDLEQDYVDEWKGCDPRSNKGDKALIYRTSPNSHIRYIVEILENAKPTTIDTDRGEEEGFSCKYKVLCNFSDESLSIHEIRDYPSLKEWYPLRLNFRRMVFKIEEKYWNKLRDILITKKRDSKDSF